MIEAVTEVKYIVVRKNISLWRELQANNLFSLRPFYIAKNISSALWQCTGFPIMLKLHLHYRKKCINWLEDIVIVLSRISIKKSLFAKIPHQVFLTVRYSMKMKIQHLKSFFNATKSGDLHFCGNSSIANIITLRVWLEKLSLNSLIFVCMALIACWWRCYFSHSGCREKC